MTKREHHGVESNAASDVAGSLRILVVDENRDSLWSLLVLLEQAGHDVRGAFNAKEALHVLETFKAEVLVADIALPDRSGQELAGKLRENAKTRPLLIGISGKSKKDADGVVAELGGFDHYLVKPYQPSALFKLFENSETRS